jgi:hypothetical protein
VSYTPITSPLPTAGALLVEGDLLNDIPLLKWLDDSPRLDAVVLWLAGSHGGRQNDRGMPEMRRASPAQLPSDARDHHLPARSAVAQARRIVHFVQRLRVPVDERLAVAGARDTLGGQIETAGVPLRLETVTFRDYDEPDVEERVRMVETPPLVAGIELRPRMSFVSTLARMP